MLPITLWPNGTDVSEPLADYMRHTGDKQAPQVARVLRAVTEDTNEKEENS